MEKDLETQIKEEVAKAQVYQPTVEDPETGKQVLERPDLPDLYRVDGTEFGWSIDVHAANEKEARKAATEALIARKPLE